MTNFCKTEIFFGLNRIRIKKIKNQNPSELKLDTMSANANVLLKQVGIYTELMNIVNDYTVGERSFWKGKYDSVVSELNSELEKEKRFRRDINNYSDTFQARLGRIIAFSTQRKIACITQRYGECINDTAKTMSVQDYFKRYNVVGIHRIAFDNLVFRLKQMIRVKDYKVYKFKSNSPPIFQINLTSRLMRHLNDYSHEEYECYIGEDSNKLWPTKMNWGDRKIQQQKRIICNEIKAKYDMKQHWVRIMKKQTENRFSENYQLTPTVKISHVNEKSIRVRVNTFDGKPVEVTKKISQDKKTNRLYICDPVLKKRRLYADKKYVHCPSEYLTLYKTM